MTTTRTSKLTAYRVVAGTYGQTSAIQSYRDLDQAEHHAQQLRTDGWDAFVVTVTLVV